MPFDAFIPLHNLFRIDRQLLVGVHHHAEKTGVCLEQKWMTINTQQSELLDWCLRIKPKGTSVTIAVMGGQYPTILLVRLDGTVPS